MLRMALQNTKQTIKGLNLHLTKSSSSCTRSWELLPLEIEREYTPPQKNFTPGLNLPDWRFMTFINYNKMVSNREFYYRWTSSSAKMGLEIWWWWVSVQNIWVSKATQLGVFLSWSSNDLSSSQRTTTHGMWDGLKFRHTGFVCVPPSPQICYGLVFRSIKPNGFHGEPWASFSTRNMVSINSGAFLNDSFVTLVCHWVVVLEFNPLFRSNQFGKMSEHHSLCARGLCSGSSPTAVPR